MLKVLEKQNWCRTFLLFIMPFNSTRILRVIIQTFPGVGVFNEETKEWEDFECAQINEDSDSFDDYCDIHNFNFSKALIEENKITF